VTSIGETDSQTYTITPAWGYDIADVVVDTVSQGAITTYTFPEPVAVKDVKRAAARGAQRYLNLPGLLRKNYCLSEDGLRASGVYVWESRSRAETFYNTEWKVAMTRQYGVAPEIVYLHSPVMVDNVAGRIVVDEE
jgi:hypothetical protein